MPVSSKILALGLVLGLAGAGTGAGAVTFSLGGGDPYLLPGTFDPAPARGGPGPGTEVIRNAALSLDGPGRITFSYARSEAGWTNTVSAGGTAIFGNKAVTNPPVTLDFGPGLLPLRFSTKRPALSVANGDAIDSYYGSIAFFQRSPSVVYALFNDAHRSDRDYDDLAVRLDVAPVPLPAAAWMLLAGLGALGLAARRRAASPRA